MRRYTAKRIRAVDNADSRRTASVTVPWDALGIDEREIAKWSADDFAAFDAELRAIIREK